MSRSLGEIAVSAEAFLAEHLPFHPIVQTAHVLRDGGLILSVRCTVCAEVYIEATAPKRRTGAR